MTGKELKALREAASLTQAEAAERIGVRRLAVIEAEKNPDKALSSKMRAGVEALAGADASPVAKRSIDGEDIGGGFRLRRDAKGNPYGTTSAETRAIRLHLNKGSDQTAPTPLIDLRPIWRKLEGGREVNAAIPDPLSVAPPAWTGARGVVTKSGRVFDYETAHQLRNLTTTRAA